VGWSEQVVPVHVKEVVMEQVEEEQKVPATATPAHTVEADVLLIAKLNASLRSHFLLEHPDRPQVKAERAACLQRIRATMAATHQVGFLLMPSGGFSSYTAPHVWLDAV
jgi:hypothetical protein